VLVVEMLHIPLKALWAGNHFTLVWVLPWLELGCVDGLGRTLVRWRSLLLAMSQACGAIAKEVSDALSSTFLQKSFHS